MKQPAQPEEQSERDPSEDLAQWLQEVGRRRNRAPKEPDEALPTHLEELAGRAIRTREEISDYLRELSEKTKEKRASAEHLKNALLAALLVLATLQHYFIDVQLEIFAQPRLTVFVPLKELPPQKPTPI